VFKIKGDDLYHDEVLVGPKNQLYIDSNELKELPLDISDHIQRIKMPHRIDMVFTTGDKVIGIESKKAKDLNDSINKHRLSRQLRMLMSEVDVPCLLMRGIPKRWRGIKKQNAFNEDMFRIWWELVSYQALGIFILPGPSHDELVLPWLEHYSIYLAGGRSPLASIKQSDIQPTKPKRPGWFLKNIKGIGDRYATKLHNHFGSTRNALLAEYGDWQRLKIPPSSEQSKEEALK
jgi:ERCC4-type nuclease